MRAGSVATACTSTLLPVAWRAWTDSLPAPLCGPRRDTGASMVGDAQAVIVLECGWRSPQQAFAASSFCCMRGCARITDTRASCARDYDFAERRLPLTRIQVELEQLEHVDAQVELEQLKHADMQVELEQLEGVDMQAGQARAARGRRCAARARALEHVNVQHKRRAAARACAARGRSTCSSSLRSSSTLTCGSSSSSLSRRRAGRARVARGRQTRLVAVRACAPARARCWVRAAGSNGGNDVLCVWASPQLAVGGRSQKGAPFHWAVMETRGAKAMQARTRCRSASAHCPAAGMAIFGSGLCGAG